MASILSLHRLGFRSRNPQRDRNTDITRLEKVRQSISAAIAEAQNEYGGLKQRLELNYARAASLVDAGEWAARDTIVEAELLKTESHIASARARLASLEGEIERLDGLLDLAMRNLNDNVA